MDVPEILRRIERTTGLFERDAIAAAAARREEVTPHLLSILQHTIDNAKQIAVKCRKYKPDRRSRARRIR